MPRGTSKKKCKCGNTFDCSIYHPYIDECPHCRKEIKRLKHCRAGR